MKTRTLACAAAAALAVFTLAPSAFAADTGNGRNQPIIGNVVGDNTPDRTTLGYDSTGCTATVERGLGHGHYAAPVVHRYTVTGVTDPALCPDMGATVQRRATPIDDLVVTWFVLRPGITTPLVVLRHFHVLSASTAGGEFPSYVGSQDFNGDRRGDLWESTDEDANFTTYLRSGSGFVPGPASFFNDTTLPSLAFGKLDRNPGTDIAAGYRSSRRDQAGLPGSAGSGALVVFGSTGHQVLLEHDATGHTTYTVALLDANCDGKLDVKVSGGSAAPRIYLNDGNGHFALGV